MKIALVVPGGVDRSGERRVIPALLAVIKRLASRHEVHVYATHQEGRAQHWILHGAQVHNADCRARRIHTLMSVIHEHRRARFDVIHAFWAGTSGFVAVSAAKILRVPSVVHVAGGELIALPSISYGGALRWHSRRLTHWVLANASAVSAASAPIIEQIAALGFHARRIPLGVDLEVWPPQAPHKRESMQPIRLIHLASLNRVKDPITLLRALRSIAARGRAAFHLDMIGEDTLSGRIQALAHAWSLQERITFHGFLTYSHVRPLFAGAHVNVICSLHEAGPLALLEAAVAGVPTVGTAVGHVAEWSPTAALAVPVGNAEALANALLTVFEDESLRMRLALAAQTRALMETADATAFQIETLYGELQRR